ncbi:crossover junction endodeoxyribonuclease RuvC [Salinibacterium sp. NSLL150]|uniref:crossover junction endodeoxyribonuclease RuvC n=1 Tax=unclassified Salinibacterium TaxID=2632331 RepID=UPI0018CF7ACD|nr:MULTISPECIES: crossover junction endodeoxyribonuclease RuvC [unclassified Salinibacterium]MBH0024075.1 crossover junction endodeoxyribonuclease RuvC [Salinibacterium sp. SWN248]MBH0099040.1 crossover junction endodeoxyribonuclease RuvC [Salinibacterium sp. NSLL35]MBH0101794.1 crossover junction endodeoxyribonuclease RuvC [Salinibacterium sp. NSLL150]MBH0104554.1 crossover junction endodeoxyribonuclease RuvC [Salinibacterium sp. NSLL16]MBH0107314.1 crossover junction endodeoxyribonuclease Ru
MTLRVIGIDPGLTRCGIGVVDVAPNRRATLVYVGVVRTPPAMALEERLREIGDGIDAIIAEFAPQQLALERVFAQNNVSTVMGTAQASGVAMYVAARHGIPVTLHTPTEVKLAITGYGGAEKKQVGAMVARVLGLAEAPKPADAADACALAICGAWKSGPGFTAAPVAARSGAAGAPAESSRSTGLTPAQEAWRSAEKSAGARRLNL